MLSVMPVVMLLAILMIVTVAVFVTEPKRTDIPVGHVCKHFRETQGKWLCVICGTEDKGSVN